MSIYNEVLKRLKAVETAPFLFVGSGLSKRYLNLENWEELLREFSEEINENQFQYDIYLSEVTEDNKEYGKLPKIAELLEKDFTKFFLTNPKYNELRNKNVELIKKGVSPFKIALSEHFQDIYIDYNNPEIKLLKKLADKNIAGIITTNYDTFIENIFEGYKTYIGQEELLFSTIYETGEIYKIHGCCTKPQSIVITERDYKDFIAKNDYLTAKLLTIFLEHPIVFIGYSISDKNIQNIIKSISNCLPKDKLEILKNRFIFIEWTPLNKSEITTYSISFENGNSVEMTKVTINDFSELYKAFLENKTKYNPKVLRGLKKDIYDLVLTENPKEKIKVVGLENVENYENLDVVLGVGVLKEYGKKGYLAIKAQDLYKDIVFNAGEYDNENIVKVTLPELLKSNSGGLPMYKYIKNYSKDLPLSLTEAKKSGIDEFLNRTLLAGKVQKRKTLIEKSIAWIRSKYSLEETFKWIPYLNEDEIIIGDLESYLRDLLKEFPRALDEHSYKSDIKRVIRIYDYLKYK